MRKFFLTTFVLAASLVVASTGLALEKTAARADDLGGAGWAAGTATCSVSYYNTCTGWVWVWSGFSPSDTYGTQFDACGTSCTLDASALYVWTAAISGYGFTGTIDVSNADANNCPAGNLASQPFLPVSGWNTYIWGTAVPSSFTVSFTTGADYTVGNPTAFATDHPAAGPTGPAACGTCYPVDRVNHSFYWGNATTALCPGSPLDDGVCAAQMLHEAYFTCIVSVEDESWGAVKNLYR